MNHVLQQLKDQQHKPEEPGEPEEDIPEIVSLSADEGGVPEIGIDAAFISEMESETLQMADTVNETTIAQETEAMQAHEKNRDNLATYILTRITCAGSLPLQAERDAGKALYKVVKPYIGIARLAVAKETAAIRGLLIDLRKEEYATYVATLGFTATWLSWRQRTRRMMPSTRHASRVAQPSRLMPEQSFVVVWMSITRS